MLYFTFFYYSKCVPFIKVIIFPLIQFSVQTVNITAIPGTGMFIITPGGILTFPQRHRQ